MTDWMQRAACRRTDPDLFFPERGDRAAAPAKAVCAKCKVTTDCLMYAVENGIVHGVWGGRSEKERRRLRAEKAA